MSKKSFLSAFLIIILSSIGYCTVVGDFEDSSLDGWTSSGTTLSQTDTGVTLGSSAMQIDAGGGWKMAAMKNAKPYMGELATGADVGGAATISADITISSADTDGTWANVEIVINAQDNDNNGTNNNLGWNSLGAKDLIVDGTSYTYQWSVTPALRDAIAGADDTIQWFELVMVTDNDANSISLQVDNVQINEAPTSAVIGNFEDGSLDGWTSDVTISQGTEGVTLGSSSLKIEKGSGNSNGAGKLNAKPYLTLMGSGVYISADITVLPGDFDGSSISTNLIINAQNNDSNGANNNLGWNPLGAQSLTVDGQSHTYTWPLTQYLTDKIAAADSSIAWFEIFIGINNDGTGATIYIDNVKIAQPEPVVNPPRGIVIGDFETDLEGWWTVTGDSTIAQAAEGASTGTGAMQVTNENGWKVAARLDAKPYRTILASEGARITMDVTVFGTDMPDGWLNIGAVINAQNNDDNGTNNNIGWNDMGQQPVTIDGQPHTLTFDLPAEVIAKISGTDDTISWFELVITKDSGPGIFYVDNVKVFPAPDPIDYSYGVLVGNFEIGFDNWGTKDGSVLTRTETGATLGTMALQVDMAGSGWHQYTELDIKPYRTMIAAGARISADITIFPEDFTGDEAGYIEMFLNCQSNDNNGPNNNIGYQSLGTRTPTMDGKPHTYTWVLSDTLRQAVAGSDDGISWFNLTFVANNNSPTFRVYLDNIWIYIPETATYPSPADGAVEIDVLPTLSWLAGGGGIKHDVYIGTDQAAVTEVNRDNLVTYPDILYVLTDQLSVDLSKLDLNTTYWWRVDEIEDVNETLIVPGDVWSFTTANNVNLEDFESYADYADLLTAWSDANDLSMEPVHQGKGAMKLTANNTKTPYYSEATLEVPDYFTNLIEGNMAVMELYFYGDPNNAQEKLYVRIEDNQGNWAAKLYPGDPEDIQTKEWQLWRITLSDFTGVDLSDVATISIGHGDRNNPVPGGTIEKTYIDDIRLFPARCILELRDPDFAAIDFAPIGVNPGDCSIDISEFMIMAADWVITDMVLPAVTDDPNESGGRLAYYMLDEGEGTVTPADANDPSPVGTLNGGVTWITPGYNGTGSAVHFDGSNGTRIELGTIDPTESTGQMTLSAWIRWSGAQSPEHQGIIGKRDDWAATNAMSWFIETDPLGRIALRQYFEAEVDIYSPSGILNPFIGKWAHVAVTFDGTTAVIYLNGAQVMSAPFVLADKPDANMGIGNTHGGGSGETFVGDIDEVQIYNRTLSAEEVAYLADTTPGDGQLDVPIASVADISSNEPAGQKSINLSDLAVLGSYWMKTDMAVIFE